MTPFPLSPCPSLVHSSRILPMASLLAPFRWVGSVFSKKDKGEDDDAYTASEPPSPVPMTPFRDEPAEDEAPSSGKKMATPPSRKGPTPKIAKTPKSAKASAKKPEKAPVAKAKATAKKAKAKP